MKVNLNTLNKAYIIEDYVEIPEYFYENTDILKLDPVYVSGKIDYNITDEIEIDLNVKGKMYLSDAITLDEIEYPFLFNINETVEELGLEVQESLKKSQNILDIIEILWENIILEVPISVTKAQNTQLKGDGWELNGEELEDEIDPRLQKLNDLFKGGE